jgi:hypothetical protein
MVPSTLASIEDPLLTLAFYLVSDESSSLNFYLSCLVSSELEGGFKNCCASLPLSKNLLSLLAYFFLAIIGSSEATNNFC